MSIASRSIVSGDLYGTNVSIISNSYLSLKDLPVDKYPSTVMIPGIEQLHVDIQELVTRIDTLENK